MADNMNLAEFMANQCNIQDRRAADRELVDRRISQIRRREMRRLKKFKNAEDECICRNFMEFTTSPSEDDHRQLLWQRIHVRFEQQTMNRSARSVSDLYARFGVIKQEISRYFDIIIQQTPTLRDGETSMEFHERCRVEYRRIYGQKFHFESCFEILRHSPMFCRLF